MQMDSTENKCISFKITATIVQKYQNVKIKNIIIIIDYKDYWYVWMNLT